MRIRGHFNRAALLLLVLVPVQLSAQVGHAPSASPYRDIVYSHSLTALYGDFGGNGGKLGIGAHNGQVFGGRVDLRLSTPLQIGLGVSQANLERLIVDADDSVATRVKGPVNQKVILAELAVQWNITGKKSWHRLAPYFGVGAGFAIGQKTPADTSGYKFGNKFYAAPNIGTRIFITDRLHLRAEGRLVYWKLKYPSSYGQEPADQPGTGGVSNAVIQDGKFDQWVSSRHLLVGLGYSLSLF